jgi:hypothetical protein
MLRDKVRRNIRDRALRQEILREDPVRAREKKEKEKQRSRDRRAAMKAKQSKLFSLDKARGIRTLSTLPKGYAKRSDIDNELEMYAKEDTFRQCIAMLNPNLEVSADEETIAKYVGSWIQRNHENALKECRGHRFSALNEENEKSIELFELLANSIFCARSSITLLPHSSLMVHRPDDAISLLDSWVDTYALCVKIQSHMMQRRIASSQGVYYDVF